MGQAPGGQEQGGKKSAAHKKSSEKANVFRGPGRYQGHQVEVSHQGHTQGLEPPGAAHQGIAHCRQDQEKAKGAEPGQAGGGGPGDFKGVGRSQVPENRHHNGGVQFCQPGGRTPARYKGAQIIQGPCDMAGFL